MQSQLQQGIMRNNRGFWLDKNKVNCWALAGNPQQGKSEKFKGKRAGISGISNIEQAISNVEG
jgi:hypothetical protein